MRRLFTATLAALVLMVPSIAQAEGWTQPGYDVAASRHNTQQSPIDASKWQLKWSKFKGFTTNPLILEDRIIVGGHKSGYKVYLWCFDLQGNKLWTRQVGIGYPRESIALVDGAVEFEVYNQPDGDLDNATPEIEYVDPQTGKKVSSIEFPGHPLDRPRWGLSPLIDGERWLGASYFCCSIPIPNPVVGSGVAIIYEGTSVSIDPQTWVHTRTLVCEDHSSAYAMCVVDTATGQTLWILDTAVEPTIVGDVVFASCGFTYSICRRDLRTGAILSVTPDFTHGSAPEHWLDLPDLQGMGAPAVGGGVYFASAFDSTLGKWVTAGFDDSTGDLLTRRRGLYGPVGGWYTAVANGLLVSTVPGLRVVSFDRA